MTVEIYKYWDDKEFTLNDYKRISIKQFQKDCGVDPEYIYPKLLEGITLDTNWTDEEYISNSTGLNSIGYVKKGYTGSNFYSWEELENLYWNMSYFLKERLNHAMEEENYELCSFLTEKLNKRQ
jgi:hypothetical protein